MTSRSKAWHAALVALVFVLVLGCAKDRLPDDGAADAAGPAASPADATEDAAADAGLPAADVVDAGVVPDAPVRTFPLRVGDGLLALYLFDDVTKDGTVRNHGGSVDADVTVYDGEVVPVAGRGGVLVEAARVGRVDASALITAIKESGALSAEVWCRPQNPEARGPSRILGIELDWSKRNLLIGQDDEKLAVRLRLDADPDASTHFVPGVFVSSLVHVLLVYDHAQGAVVYVDGQAHPLIEPSDEATLSEWDLDHHLGIGNLLEDERAWFGEFHLAAFYDRALSADEVARNFAAGPRGDAEPLASRRLSIETVDDQENVTEGGAVGGWRIIRDGDLSGPLEAHYRLLGSAIPELDYERLTESVVIPATEASAIVPLLVSDDGVTEGTETAILQLLPAQTYGVVGRGRRALFVTDASEIPGADVLAHWFTASSVDALDGERIQQWPDSHGDALAQHTNIGGFFRKSPMPALHVGGQGAYTFASEDLGSEAGVTVAMVLDVDEVEGGVEAGAQFLVLGVEDNPDANVTLIGDGTGAIDLVLPRVGQDSAERMRTGAEALIGVRQITLQVSGGPDGETPIEVVLRIAGQEIGRISVSGQPAFSWNANRFGAHENSGMSAGLREAMFYRSNLSGDTLAAVEAYLATKHGL